MSIVHWSRLGVGLCLGLISAVVLAQTPAEKFKKILPAIDLILSGETVQVYNIYADHLNTPRLIANQANQAVWRWDNNDPFGGNAPDENPSGLGAFSCNLRLPGQYFDKETNLHYNYFRDYAADIGRYWQSDPIGLEAGINTYAYVLNNPLTAFDPFGLLTILGCDPAQKRQLETAAGKASAAASTSCVSCEDRSELKRRIDNVTIQCTTYSTAVGPYGKEVSFCGAVRRGNPTVFISPLAFTNPKCGCLQALVLHESAHTLAIPYTDDPNDPRNANNLARRCFKCAP